MRHLSAIRRLAPWMLAPALLASLPAVGVQATAASSTALQSEQTIAMIGSAGSMSSLATASAAAPASTTDAAAAPALAGLVNRSHSRRPVAGKSATVPASLSVPVVAPTPVSTTSGASLSFAGLNDYQQREIAAGGNQFTITPPDQGLCVGNGYVMETLNDVVRVFDTSGQPLTEPIATNAFYHYPYIINRTTGRYGPEPTDPNCYYDPQYSRWYHVVLTIEVDRTTGAILGPNHLDIAVSKTSNPTAGWVFYHLPVQDDGTQGTPRHTGCPCLGDFPHIGADANGFYITTNEYPWSSAPGIFGNNYNGAQIYAFSKAALARAASTLRVVHIAAGTLSRGVPSFTLWPDEVPGTAFDTRNNGSEWFTQSAATQETLNQTGMSRMVGVWRLTNTASLSSTHPSLQLRATTLQAEAYGVPPQSEQKVGPVPLRDCLLVQCISGIGPSPGEVEGPLDSSDSRIQTDWLAGGKLFTALDTIATVRGRDQAAVAYFVINTAASLSGVSLASQGYEAVAGNVTYPSIATLPNGSGAMAITLVGATYFPSAAYMTVGPNGPTGPVVVAASGVGPDDEFCQYRFYNCAVTPTPAIRPRWGDYGAAQVDGGSVWIASEYIGQRCTIQQYEVDPTCGATRAPLGNWDTRISRITP